MISFLGRLRCFNNKEKFIFIPTQSNPEKNCIISSYYPLNNFYLPESVIHIEFSALGDSLSLWLLSFGFPSFLFYFFRVESISTRQFISSFGSVFSLPLNFLSGWGFRGILRMLGIVHSLFLPFSGKSYETVYIQQKFLSKPSWLGFLKTFR